MRRNKGDEVCNSANINFYYFLIIEKYFDMNKKNCKDGLDIYKKFITRMDRVSDFLKVAEDVGFDKDDIPDLSKVGRIKQQLVCRQQRNYSKKSNKIAQNMLMSSVYIQTLTKSNQNQQISQK